MMRPIDIAKGLVHRFEIESQALHRVQREWLEREIAAEITVLHEAENAVWSSFVGRCEAIENAADDDLARPICNPQEEGFVRGMRHAAKSIRRSIEHPKYVRQKQSADD